MTFTFTSAHAFVRSLYYSEVICLCDYDLYLKVTSEVIHLCRTLDYDLSKVVEAIWDTGFMTF